MQGNKKTTSKYSKIVIVLQLVLIIVLCSACSPSEKPQDMSEHDYSAGIKALETVDEYLDFELSSDEAREILDQLYDDVVSEGLAFGDEYYAKNFALSSYLVIVSSSILNDSISSDYESVLADRNALAETINIPER